MKSVTEFWNVTLNKGLQARTALTAEGKTPEEIQTARPRHRGYRTLSYTCAPEAMGRRSAFYSGGRTA